MKSLFLLFSFFLASGCVTTSDVMQITSEPVSALVSIPGYGECETPCTVRLDTVRKAKVAKAGYVSKTLYLTPGRKTFFIRLELAAPTTNIDSAEMPELD